jgi:hypothetical protein
MSVPRRMRRARWPSLRAAEPRRAGGVGIEDGGQMLPQNESTAFQETA